MPRRVALAQDHAPVRGAFAGAVAGPLLTVVVLGLLALLVYGDATMAEVVLVFGINAIMVVGYQLFVGNTGIVSFGHVAFMAIGAYTAGAAAMPVDAKTTLLPSLPGLLGSAQYTPLSALLIGGVAAALLALVAGVALMRLSGATASIATLGLLIIVTNVIAQATPLTRGPQALYGVPQATTFPWVFGTLAAVTLASGAYKWSRYGRRARAVRDAPQGAEGSGVRVFTTRLGAFTLSAFVTGVGGGLYAMLLTAFTPGSFYIPQLVIVLVMAIIGGVASITGSLLGAAVVTVLAELLREVESGVALGGLVLSMPTGVSSAVLGIGLIAMLRWRPQGLLGSGEVIVATSSISASRRETAVMPGPSPLDDHNDARASIAPGP